MKKKGLAYIGGPKQLKDFIWMYLNLGKEYEWTLICQPMFPQMKLKEICENSGLFSNIIMADAYITRPKVELGMEFLKLFFFWIIGKNKYYAKNEVKKLVDIDSYDLLVVSTTRGVLCGMMVLAADCDQIIVMEDGIGDNTNPNEKFLWSDLFSPMKLGEYLSAKMGYFNINGRFPLESYRKCDKYTEKPEEACPALYKSLNKLNDLTAINKKEYDEILQRTYGKITDLSGYDLILFTSNLKDFTGKYSEKIKQIEFFLNKNFDGKKIIVKRHPRDLHNYYFANFEVDEINSMIPAESLISKLNSDIYILFFYPSTTVKSFLEKGIDVSIFRFSDMPEIYRSSFERALSIVTDDLSEGRINIIDL